MQIRYLRLGLVSLIVGFYAFLIARPINLFTADLGRHITNGRLLITQGILPTTNYYSYTHPDYPFVNHHWGSGIIFYGIDQLLGPIGLSLFFVVLSTFTLLCYLYLTKETSNLETALVTSLILMPVLINRTEIRPEIFSNLFLGIELLMLWSYSQKRLSPKWLIGIPLIQLLWINLHIYFVFGFFLMGCFWIDTVIRERRIPTLLTGVIGVSLLTSLINPVGLKGLLYPLSIFQDYGYRLFENMSVVFLDNLMGYQPNLFFKLTQLVLVVSFIYRFTKKRPLSPAFTILALVFSILAWRQVRNFTLYALVVLPIIADNAKGLLSLHLKPLGLSMAGGIFFIIIIFSSIPYYTSHLKPSLGLLPQTHRSIQFFHGNQLQGPIFNNYDIGGFLIYYLQPHHKVFVDNRPEAYPTSFFQDIYIPMQEKSEVWEKVDAEYHFNTIFFYRHDLTPWAQQFLITRIQDPSWAPVFLDDYVIIFVKRNPTNQSVINLFEIPQSRFALQ